MIKPKPLQIGDKVGIIAPASPIDINLINKCVDSLSSLGLDVKVGESCTSEYGFLSGTDEIRAKDVNLMFADTPEQIIEIDNFYAEKCREVAELKGMCKE